MYTLFPQSICQFMDKVRDVNESNFTENHFFTEDLVIEECSELIKAIMKQRRPDAKDDHTDEIIEEACDVLHVVYSLLRHVKYSDDDIIKAVYTKLFRAWYENSSTMKFKPPVLKAKDLYGGDDDRIIDPSIFWGMVTRDGTHKGKE